MCSAIMGLMLAANARNLKQTSASEKTAYGYFWIFKCISRKAINLMNTKSSSIFLTIEGHFKQI
jgi:hypothetical protein